MSPFEAIAASMNVPASIWSGTTEYWWSPFNSFTPLIFIVSVPAPLISAPIEFKKLATSTMWGSFAQLSKIVVPSASVAASIKFIVAPTEIISKYIFAPVSFSAVAIILPWVISTVAPNDSKPFICWSIGRTPNLHPPGNPTIPWWHLPKRLPNK